MLKMVWRSINHTQGPIATRQLRLSKRRMAASLTRSPAGWMFACVLFCCFSHAQCARWGPHAGRTSKAEVVAAFSATSAMLLHLQRQQVEILSSLAYLRSHVDTWTRCESGLGYRSDSGLWVPQISFDFFPLPIWNVQQ